MDKENIKKCELNLIALVTNNKNLIDKVDISQKMFQTPEYGIYFKEIINSYKSYGYINTERLETLKLISLYSECKKMSSNFKIKGELNELLRCQDAIREAYAHRESQTLITQYNCGRISLQKLAKDLTYLGTKTIFEHEDFTAEKSRELLRKKANRLCMGRFDAFNKVLNLQPHDLLTLTAETSAGKTALALNFLVEMLPFLPCVYFNMEMSDLQINRRLIAIKSGLYVNELQEFEKMSLDHQTIADQATEMFKGNSLELVNGPQTLRSIRNCITTHDQSKPFIVFIDHMGFIVDDSKTYSSHTIELDSIMRELRRLSEEFNCTIINVCQLSRPKDDKKITLSRLKGSSEIEQSSVQVVAIQRIKDVDLALHELIYRYEIDILKNRNGSTATFDNVNFDKRNQRWEINPNMD